MTNDTKQQIKKLADAPNSVKRDVMTGMLPDEALRPTLLKMSRKKHKQYTQIRTRLRQHGFLCERTDYYGCREEYLSDLGRLVAESLQALQFQKWQRQLEEEARQAEEEQRRQAIQAEAARRASEAEKEAAIRRAEAQLQADPKFIAQCNLLSKALEDVLRKFFGI